MGKQITVMIVPDRSSRVRRLRVSLLGLQIAIGVVLLLLGGLTWGIVRFWNVGERLSENQVLKEENVELRSAMVTLHQKMSLAQATLDRVQRFDTKVREITQLHDPKRHLALGPIEKEAGPLGITSGPDEIDPLVQAIGDNPKIAIDLMATRLKDLATEAEREEGSIRHLEAYLRSQKARLATTPSVWPARGWMTSGFGTRVDPMTRKRTMHRGVDISNQPGVPVMASAKGIVTFSATSGGYGKVIVLDHGYGVRTRYAHLGETKVKVGDHINRGDIIGTLGNTGRSTGPHLHYEVEVNGVCENPMNYILED